MWIRIRIFLNVSIHLGPFFLIAYMIESGSNPANFFPLEKLVSYQTFFLLKNAASESDFFPDPEALNIANPDPHHRAGQD